LTQYSALSRRNPYLLMALFNSRRVWRMASPLGILLVVVGILFGLAGGGLLLHHQTVHSDCQDDSHRALHGNDCIEADAEYSMGISGLIIAGIITFIGIVLLASGAPKSLQSQFICPRCRALLTYQDSPANCYSCGFPIDWSIPQAPQK